MFEPAVTVANHFSKMKEVPSSGIILSREVRRMCERNACGYYGKSWTCPPAIDSIEYFRGLFKAFDTLLIVYRVYALKNSFDWKGMKNGIIDFTNRLLAVKHETEEASPEEKCLYLGAGSCHLCDSCAFVDGQPCRNPHDAIISLEACGIDVVRLMKDHGLPYYNGKNTVTFIGGILYCRNF
jgi:predicted metal-binding protein